MTTTFHWWTILRSDVAVVWGGPYQIDDKRGYHGSDVAHDVDEGNALGAYHGGKNLRGVLQADVVRNVHAETAEDSQNSWRYTCKHTNTMWNSPHYITLEKISEPERGISREKTQSSMPVVHIKILESFTEVIIQTQEVDILFEAPWIHTELLLVFEIYITHSHTLYHSLASHINHLVLQTAKIIYYKIRIIKIYNWIRTLNVYMLLLKKWKFQICWNYCYGKRRNTLRIKRRMTDGENRVAKIIRVVWYIK